LPDATILTLISGYFVAIAGDPSGPRMGGILLKLAEGVTVALLRLRLMAAQSGTVLGAGTSIALHSLWVIPQFVQRNRLRSPMVRGDQGSTSIDDKTKGHLEQ
jgi:hypothetical protein